MYVIKGEDVKWIPAFDMNRVIMGGQIVVAIALLTLRTVVKTVSRVKEKEYAAPSE
jgi:TRAP-type C4-dicarboxylate transport system permease small subunit